MDPTQVDARYQIQFLAPGSGFSYQGINPSTAVFSDQPLQFDQASGFLILDQYAALRLASLLQQGVIGTAGGQQLQGDFFLVGPGGGSSPPSWSPDYWAVTLQNGSLAFYGDAEGPLTQPNAFINWNLPGGTPELQFSSSGNMTMLYATGGAGDFNLQAQTGNAFLQMTGTGDLFTWASGSHTLQSTDATVTFPQGIVPGAPAFDFAGEAGDFPYYSLQDGLYAGIYDTVFGGLVFSGGILTDDSGSYAVPLTGDVTGDTSASMVSSLQGFPLSLSGPAVSNVIEWDGANLVFGAGGGGGLAIGSPVSGGTANRVLFEDASVNLADSTYMTFNPVNGTLTVYALFQSGSGASFNNTFGSANFPHSAWPLGVTSGALLAGLCGFGTAGHFDDGTNGTDLCDGTWSINVFNGSIQVIGTLGNTYAWANESFSAPSENSTIPPTSVWGTDDGSFLGPPDHWLAVNAAGNNCVIPAYNV